MKRVRVAGLSVLLAALSISVGGQTVMPSPKFVALDDNGNPCSGCLLHAYVAGTTTAQDTFSDSSLSPGSANLNPVVLDAAGRATVYLSAASYKFILRDSTDAVTYWTQDNISANASFAVATDVTGTAGEALSAGNVVYLSDGSGSKTAGRWYQADADFTYASSLAVAVGMAPAAITSGSAGSIRLAGRLTGLSGLVAGTVYYVSATAGSLTSSAPANTRFVGAADSTTSLILSLPVSANYALLNAANAFTSTGTTSFAGPVALASTKKLYLDGVAGTGDTYLLESSANVLSLFSGGVEAKWTSGVLTASGFGAHTFSAGGTGTNGLSIRNTTAGTGNYARYSLGNDGGADLSFLTHYSTTYTTSGPKQANALALENTTSAGIDIAASHASGAIRFYSGGSTEVGRWHTDGDFYTTAWTDYSGTSTVTGWSSFTTKIISYKKIGKLVFVDFYIDGTSNATTASFTLPFAAATITGGDFGGASGNATDNGVALTRPAWIRIASGASSVTCFTAFSGGGAWTAANSKTVSGQLWYQTS